MAAWCEGLVDLNERALQLRTGGPREEDDGTSGPYGEPGARVCHPCFSLQLPSLAGSTLRVLWICMDSSPARWSTKCG